MTKGQRSGFFTLITLIVLIEVLIQFYPKWTNDEVQVEFTPTEEALALQYASKELKSNVENNTLLPVDIKPFNPNALDEDGFMRLGFSPKQAKSIIKYRYILGGNFSTIQEFGESYVISDKKLEELRPFIRLKNVVSNQKQQSKQPGYGKGVYKPKVNLNAFYPNKLTHTQWMKIGFSDRQAEVILNFKNSLPNKRFTTKEQLHSCYAINDYMYNKIEPYIRFQKDVNVETITEDISNDSKTYNANTMSESDWESLGFTNDEAEGIIKCKTFKGGFVTIDDIKSCSFVDVEDINRIKGQLVFK